MIEEMKFKVKCDYDRICKAIPEFSRHPFDDFLKIRVVSSSAYFGVTCNGVETQGLIPYAGDLYIIHRFFPS